MCVCNRLYNISFEMDTSNHVCAVFISLTDQFQFLCKPHWMLHFGNNQLLLRAPNFPHPWCTISFHNGRCLSFQMLEFMDPGSLHLCSPFYIGSHRWNSSGYTACFKVNGHPPPSLLSLIVCLLYTSTWILTKTSVLLFWHVTFPKS